MRGSTVSGQLTRLRSTLLTKNGLVRCVFAASAQAAAVPCACHLVSCSRVLLLLCGVAQVRAKYHYKKRSTSRHGPIACNETFDWAASTADTYQCSDNFHRSAESCNFKCLPTTCVIQEMIMKEFGPSGLQRY